MHTTYILIRVGSAHLVGCGCTSLVVAGLKGRMSVAVAGSSNLGGAGGPHHPTPSVLPLLLMLARRSCGPCVDSSPTVESEAS